jgi:hypothetical protein
MALPRGGHFGGSGFSPSTKPDLNLGYIYTIATLAEGRLGAGNQTGSLTGERAVFTPPYPNQQLGYLTELKY